LNRIKQGNLAGAVIQQGAVVYTKSRVIGKDGGGVGKDCIGVDDGIGRRWREVMIVGDYEGVGCGG